MTKPITKKQIKQGREYWQSHIKTWQQSGQTRAVYCDQHGLNLKTFAYWRHRLKSENVPVKLVQIPVGMTSRPDRTVLRLVLDNRFAIEVTEDFNPATLAGVIKVVQGL